MDRWNTIRTSAIQSRSHPMRFLGFYNHETGAPMQEILKWSTVCSKFSRSGWSVVRNASFSKGGTAKKRPSSHLHKVPTQSNKVSPRTLQMALVIKTFKLYSIPAMWLCWQQWISIWINEHKGQRFSKNFGELFSVLSYSCPSMWRIFCSLPV
jgi:hypothetical protein